MLIIINWLILWRFLLSYFFFLCLIIQKIINCNLCYEIEREAKEKKLEEKSISVNTLEIV